MTPSGEAYYIEATPKQPWWKDLFTLLGEFVDFLMGIVRWLLIWICIPTLIVIVFLAAGWVEHVEKKSQEQEKRLTALELRLDGLETNRHFDMIEIENLADKILNECITDTKRPLKTKEGRK